MAQVESPRVNGAHTPKRSSLVLTEYAATPTPPHERTAVPKFDVPHDLLLPTGYPDYLRLILSSRVYDVVEETPLSHAVNLSNRLECKVWLKREDLLPVFSFKLRGAYNRMAHLPREDAWKGVIAVSAGNHAQGVAYSARHLKMPATIVMPEGTPAIKHRNVSRLGGNVVLHGPDFDSAKAHGADLQKQHGLINIPPFDDPYVIAGQGTIGAELLRQASLQNLRAIFCCVGGGGLIAGIGVYVKRIAPHIKIIGVEASDANAMVQSLAAGKRVMLKDVGLFADGAAVKFVGEETFRICQEVVDEVIQVSTDEICAAIKDVFEDTRSILEPAGALSLAGLKKWVVQNPSADVNRELVAIASGANMNFDRLKFVSERASIGEGKEALLSVDIPEKPGSFVNLVEAVLPQAVTEFNYRYSTSSQANVLMGISVTSATTRAEELESLFTRLQRDGMTAEDISNNELAKQHIRYFVGGRSTATDERVFMFTFPERPGALFRFLRTLRPGQNISAFQYRNVGGDIGNILVAIQCPDSEREELNSFLKEVGYPYTECTDDRMYKKFLRA
ncbi:Threonine dehydratase, mitochondrial [Cyphellophora attinorum]|uniref:Threonine dehydratase n=1 Tax=Cyphellophora attinorum TaxID=1664694 RepID=A0A0N1HC75_9EURO|nr:Threonine dehydratase, mitochondrial [Phialophora attinorum]KPI45977.1 Threonine dehydratase, mitochondrial [Phialophora attinorum]